MQSDLGSAQVQYMTTTRIGEKGQLTVPKQFRKDLGLAVGAPFAVLRLGDGLILLPQQARFERFCQEFSAALSGAGVTAKALLATLPKARKRVFDRRYGAVVSKATRDRELKGRQNL
jgi:AbrB family looped-hinge helix DNA binding protein